VSDEAWDEDEETCVSLMSVSENSRQGGATAGAAYVVQGRLVPPVCVTRKRLLDALTEAVRSR